MLLKSQLKLHTYVSMQFQTLQQLLQRQFPFWERQLCTHILRQALEPDSCRESVKILQCPNVKVNHILCQTKCADKWTFHRVETNVQLKRVCEWMVMQRQTFQISNQLYVLSEWAPLECSCSIDLTTSPAKPWEGTRDLDLPGHSGL